MIDASSEMPPWRQVARMLEHRIHTRQPGYEPGWVLPPIAHTARELDLGVDTVTAAYHLLANLGLVTLIERYGAVVREPRNKQTVTVPPGTVVSARMPTLAEVDRWQLDPGVPMLVAGDHVWPADRYEVRAEDGEPPPTP